MNKLRFDSVVNQALSAKKRFLARQRRWAARIAIMGEGHIAMTWMPKAQRPNGWRTRRIYPNWVTEALTSRAINTSQLPAITLAEHHWLIHNGWANVARWTRASADVEEWMDTDEFVESRTPTIRYIWVGKRSLKAHGDTSDEGEGLTASQEEQEDSAELCDIETLIDREQFRDPVTDEIRPIQMGDTLEIVHGSNEDLDALYLEEGDDPRCQNDWSAYASDHKWSESFGALSHREEEFLHSSCFTGWKNRNQHEAFLFLTEDTCTPHVRFTREMPRVVPNSADGYEDIRWKPDAHQIKVLAAKATDLWCKRHPEADPNAIRASVLEHLKAQARDLNTNEGEGYFIGRSEFFQTLDHHRNDWEHCHVDSISGCLRQKRRPAPVDWDEVRKAPAPKPRGRLPRANVTIAYSDAENQALYEGRASSIYWKPKVR